MKLLCYVFSAIGAGTPHPTKANLSVSRLMPPGAGWKLMVRPSDRVAVCIASSPCSVLVPVICKMSFFACFGFVGGSAMDFSAVECKGIESKCDEEVGKDRFCALLHLKMPLCTLCQDQGKDWRCAV